MSFKSNRQRIGSLIQMITYVDESNMDKFEIIIINREFGSHYLDLKKGIPKSVPKITP